MFNRPRCREWTPLITQQLRLRNLIQITGHRIECAAKCRLYYTLHTTSMSAPFFTSELIDAAPIAVWSELFNNTIGKSASHSVCVRIWQQQGRQSTSPPFPDGIEETSGHTQALFLWGINFSGLVLVTPRDYPHLKPNTIVLQMHGGHFTSADSFVENVDARLTRTNCDSTKEGAKLRYTFKEFYKSEIRPSYKLAKLLVFQDKQRRIKYKSESATDLMEKICMKSAFCLNLDLIATKPNAYGRTRTHSGMGRTLTRLLFQQIEQPDPAVILRAQNLRRQIETARFRCRLLTHERDRARLAMRQKNAQLGRDVDVNIEAESWLMAHYHGLSKEKEAGKERRTALIVQHDKLIAARIALGQRRQQLLLELNEIYPIRKGANGTVTINDVPLPDAKQFGESITSLALSVALGYAAHTVLMCSVILNVPLRNQIKHEGSRSKIVDNIKVMHDRGREFPLFCRTSPPTDGLNYATFLLNQNIVQLKFCIGLPRQQISATLRNLMDLLNGPPAPPPPLPPLLSPQTEKAPPSDNAQWLLSVCGSSADLNVPMPRTPESCLDEPATVRRISRSVGSFIEDDQFGGSGGGQKRNNNFTSEPILMRGHHKTKSINFKEQNLNY